MEEKNGTEINEQILERLNDINSNTVTTNNSLKDLQEYLIIQEKNRQEKEEEEKQAQAEKDKQSEENEKIAKAEKSAEESAQEETYTEILTDIKTEIQLTNQMIAGSFMFFGIICGILLFKILWDKLT